MIYVPFETSNGDLFETSEGSIFNVLSRQTIINPTGISLYRNISELNRVDKTDFLEYVGTIEGAFRDESSLIELSFTIEYKGVPKFNYIYVADFERWYIVTDITSVRTNLWEINATVDVLMTYKDDILLLPAFVDRNENEQSLNIVDKKRAVEQGYTVQVDNVENDLFNVTSGTYILTGLLLNKEGE